MARRSRKSIESARMNLRTAADARIAAAARTASLPSGTVVRVIPGDEAADMLPRHTWGTATVLGELHGVVTVDIHDRTAGTGEWATFHAGRRGARFHSRDVEPVTA